MPGPGLTYKQAGVDIAAGKAFVRRLTRQVRTTYRSGRPGVLTGLGGFAGLFSLDRQRYKEPVLAAGTDGVGTKLKVAALMDRYDTVGIDLVAMCVNDVVVTGAEPLFFLDYVAAGRLDRTRHAQVLKGIIAGCRKAGCALLGGETAELPGLYAEGDYDLAGFAVGVVERSRIIDGKRVRAGDLLIGLASSGLHSNGYSLARRIVFEKMGLTVKDRVKGFKRPIGELLLTPTRIYVRPVLALIKAFNGTIRGIAHITGGGITDNLPRILPPGLQAVVRRSAWRVPMIFGLLQKEGGVDADEMSRVFNMGIGMILIVPATQATAVVRRARALGERAAVIGEVRQAKSREMRRGAPGVAYVA